MGPLALSLRERDCHKDARPEHPRGICFKVQRYTERLQNGLAILPTRPIGSSNIRKRAPTQNRKESLLGSVCTLGNLLKDDKS